MNPITNFSLLSVTSYDNTTNLDFGFTKPSRVSGYILFISSTGVTYSIASIRSDTQMHRAASTSTQDINGVTHFLYTVSGSTTPGKHFYFKIQAVDITGTTSVDSIIVSTTTLCTIPVGNLASFDNYEVHVSWSANTELQFDHYRVNRYPLIPISDIALSGSILTAPELTTGTYVYLFDNILYNHYSGQVTSSGTIDLSVIIETATSDAVNVVSSVYNLSCYILGATPDETWTTTSTSISDTSFTTNTSMAYTIQAINTIGGASSPAYVHADTKALNTVYPFVRNPNNSTNLVVADTIWPTLKAALVGESFYQKDLWALPYIQNGIYSFTGTCGISHCNVDIFINDIYDHTTSSGVYGQFTVNYAFKKGKTKVTVQARDRVNAQFSQFSQPIYVQTIALYSWFYAIGQQYTQVLAAINYVKKGINIIGTTTPQFNDNYAPLTGLIIDGSENTGAVKSFAADIFHSFEFVGYEKGITSILDAFMGYIPDISTYSVYYNNGLNLSNMSDKVFIPTDLLLPRDRYTYLVTAIRTSTGKTEETGGLAYTWDLRYVPDGTNFYTVLTWDITPYATGYRIYRKALYPIVTSTGTTHTSTGYFYTSSGYVITSSGYVITSDGYTYITTDYAYITTATTNLFMDNGSVVSSKTYTAPIYNFSALDEVTNVKPLVNLNTSYFSKQTLKTVNFFNIILFMQGTSWLSSLNFDRLLTYLNYMTPPEKSYTLTICNDITSIVYTPLGNLA